MTINNFCGRDFMIKLDVGYFYTVAVELHPLVDLKEAQSQGEVYFKIQVAYARLKNMIKSNLFSTSYENANILFYTLEKYINVENIDQNISSEDITDIVIKAYNFETTYKAELATEQVYAITPKGAYNVEVLIYFPDQAFSPDLLILVPEVEYDVTQAARCLAFEVPTACAFHLHRINEAVLHRYWETVTQLPRLEVGSIGNYLKSIDSNVHKDKLWDKNIIFVLEQINRLHQNPVLHPELNLTSEEAIYLYGIIRSVTSAMLSAIKTAQISVSI